MNNFKIFFSVSALLFIAGCAQNPGLQPGEKSPRLVVTDGIVHWDQSESFGKVPTELIEKGNKACQGLNNDKLLWHATGYHPKGIDLKGLPFPNGSFYCESRKR
jgi:hypothetical protein